MAKPEVKQTRGPILEPHQVIIQVSYANPAGCATFDEVHGLNTNNGRIMSTGGTHRPGFTGLEFALIHARIVNRRMVKFQPIRR